MGQPLRDEEKSRSQLLDELVILRRQLACFQYPAYYEARRPRPEESSYGPLQEGLVRVMEVLAGRSFYLVDHQRRVAQLSCAIAREMGLDEDRIDLLNLAAMMHDIGKILVPVQILNKSERLNLQDWTLIRSHAQGGYNIIKNLELPGLVAQIVLQHHERMDGSGYPAGLKGKKILREARILAVPDVVEAMAYNRPYRLNLGIKQALQEISRNRDQLYDPEVVDVCLSLFAEGFEFL